MASFNSVIKDTNIYIVSCVSVIMQRIKTDSVATASKGVVANVYTVRGVVTFI